MEGGMGREVMSLKEIKGITFGGLFLGDYLEI